MVEQAGRMGVLASRDRTRFMIPIFEDIYSIKKHAKDMTFVSDSGIVVKFSRLIQAIEDGEARKRRAMKVEETKAISAGAKEQEQDDGWTLIDKKERDEDWHLL